MRFVVVSCLQPPFPRSENRSSCTPRTGRNRKWHGGNRKQSHGGFARSQSNQRGFAMQRGATPIRSMSFVLRNEFVHFSLHETIRATMVGKIYIYIASHKPKIIISESEDRVSFCCISVFWFLIVCRIAQHSTAKQITTKRSTT